MRPRFGPTLAVVLAAATLTVADQGRGSAPSLVLPGPPGLTKAPAVRMAEIRARHVRVNPAALTAGRLRLELFDDASFMAVRRRFRKEAADRAVWVGHPEGHPESPIILSAVDGIIVGNIRVGGRLFQLRYAGAGAHSLHEIDLSLHPDEEAPLNPGPLPDEPPGILQAGNDPSTTVDMMVLYTPAVRQDEGGSDAAVEALIYLALEETNLGYQNSDVAHRVQIVHITGVNYTEARDPNGNPDTATDLNNLRGTTDGEMDNIHNLRDLHCADAVSLLIDEGCGRGYILDPTNPLHLDGRRAFNVVSNECAVGNFSFGHELGHNMGCRHDWYKDDTATPTTDLHGYVDVDNAFRTIMAYNDQCGAQVPRVSCTRQLHWSNPDVAYLTHPTGVAAGTNATCTEGDPNNPDCDADNARVLDDNASIVTNFRKRADCSTGHANVWMKDRWDDAGNEPNPSNEPMWESPYIWARTSQDADLVHVHRHQNPEAGSANYVYVKLHNDFAHDETANLELYWADAATSLVWPDSWTLIDDPNITLSEYDTTIAEIQWVPPEEGHYCLLARWSDPNDPMATAEGSDPTVNAKNNNNIIQRNVNVVASQKGSSDRSTLIVRNADPSTADVDLLIELQAAADLVPPQLDTTEVEIDIGPVLYQAWLGNSGHTSSGLISRGNGVFVVTAADAAIRGIPMGGGQEQQARLTFISSDAIAVPAPFTPVDEDDLAVGPGIPQLVLRARVIQEQAGQVAGGVTYLVSLPATSLQGLPPPLTNVPILDAWAYAALLILLGGAGAILVLRRP